MTNKNKKQSADFEVYLDEYLQDSKNAREFLNSSLESYVEDGNFEAFMHALELVLK